MGKIGVKKKQTAASVTQRRQRKNSVTTLAECSTPPLPWRERPAEAKPKPGEGAFFVIPAQAGIQKIIEEVPIAWISASAGTSLDCCLRGNDT
jgi:hypothetical protein